MTVTEQYTPNYKDATRWTKPENAIGYVTSTVATAHNTKEKYATHYKTTYSKDKNGKEIAKKVADKWDYKYKTPYTLSAHDFHLDLPSNAHISTITFEVRTKANKSNVPLPHVRFNIYGKASKDKYDNTKTFSTGWNNGHYYVVDKSNHSTSFKTQVFKMGSSDVAKANDTIANYNKDVFGIDLNYPKVTTSQDNYDATISVEWVRCTVEYYIPDCNFKITSSQDTSTDVKGTESNPLMIVAGKKYVLTSKLSNGSQYPYGNVTVNYSPDDYSSISTISYHGSYDDNAKKWTVNLKGKETNEHQFYFSAMKRGLGSIDVTLGNGKQYKYYYYVSSNEGVNDGYSSINVMPLEDLHYHHTSCATITASGYSDDEYVELEINAYNVEHIDSVLNNDCQNIKEVLDMHEERVYVKLNNKGNFVLSFNYCFSPFSLSNDAIFEITNLDNPSEVYRESFKIKDVYTYKIGFKSEVIKINNHRVVSEVTTDSSIIELVSDEVDSNMIESPCTVSMDKWDDLDYIGCIPLEHLHFDPKSTYKDTLLDSRYKNKRYMGKKLASDEDITLNVQLHPHQVTTLQGLIDMDKPIPINANHLAFEGDSLNHRGWAEIYGVKVEETNPSWYKCDIDVKYLTHNLKNTRFKIDKGKKVDDYQIPSLMSEVYSSGENISDMDNDPYFVVDTDGTFYYNDESTEIISDFEDDEDNTLIVSNNTNDTYNFVFGGLSYEFTGIDDVIDFLESQGYEIASRTVGEPLKVKETVTVPLTERNNFNIGNGQHIIISTKKPLTHNSVVDFTWSSSLMPEIKENAISRIVRLLDPNNEVAFEYEYDNITIDDDEVNAEVIYRIRNNGTVIDNSRNITFRYEPSKEVDSLFGSTLTFILNNGKLSIRDSGFNGRELAIDNIELEDSTYTYQVEWINNNADAETDEIDCMFDFIVKDTVLSSNYADKFSNLIVSPFPVADKKIVFTRQAEEGSIYYYKDDGEEFSYLIEPYYQYLNGTDLVSADGISTVNLLNYGFDVVYIQNGLVRLGINRINGELYIGKYDPNSESYITVSRFHLSKFEDVNLNSIDDDKIEIQASDSVFTIWRGHPYIKVKHELEDIYIDTNYNTVWAEQVGKDNAVELPAYWDLMNNKNLLPIGVGGKIKSSDLTIVNEYVDDRKPTSLTLKSLTSDGGTNPRFSTGYVITATLEDVALTSYTDDIELDDSECSFGSLQWIESYDNS